MPVTDPPKDWSLERTGARVAEGMLRAKFGADLWGDINVGHIDTGVQRHQIFGDWVMIDRGVNFMEPGQPPIDPLKSVTLRRPRHAHAQHPHRLGDRLQRRRAGPPGRALPRVRRRHPRHQGRAQQRRARDPPCDRGQSVRGHHHQPRLSAGRTACGTTRWAMRSTSPMTAASSWSRAGGQFIDSPCYPGKFFRAICVGGYRLTEYPDDIRIYQEYGTKGRMRAWVDIWGPAKPVWRMGVRRATMPARWSSRRDSATARLSPPRMSARRPRCGCPIGGRNCSTAMTSRGSASRRSATCCRPRAKSLNGYPDFKGMVPNASPAKKGDTGLKPIGQGGGLKLDALLQVGSAAEIETEVRNAPGARTGVLARLRPPRAGPRRGQPCRGRSGAPSRWRSSAGRRRP